LIIKERNSSIDFLKFLAAILITNSHMGILYGKYGFMSTGGCIGDVLFFFCSGFTLFLKPMEGIKQFPNWYKRRISRIYPSIIAVAIIIYFFFNIHWDVMDI
jgi:peptidoglycan/LPS O-acetylase OafA/YrhL